MSKIVIFSAANPHAAANLRHSVVDGVPLAQVGDSRMLGALKAQGGSIRLWGSASGEAGRKLASWRRIDPPAVAFFYTEGSFRLTGRIWAKEPPVSENEQGNPGLAETV